MSRPTESAESNPAAESKRYDFDALRTKLSAATGRQYWRSLDELADSDGFREFLDAEFPREASVLDSVGRRQFLQVMGASMALAGLSACTKQPIEKVVPYVKAPEEVVPGEPLFFATALTVGGVARGVLVESHMGRPTKIEGNPDHPDSLGATDIFDQAAVLGLYDPDRSQVVRNIGEIRPWSAFVDAMQAEIEKQRATQGAGLRILTETITSPSLASQIGELLRDLPQAKWHQYEPLNRDNAQTGAVMAMGEALDAVLHLDQADVIVALDADILGPGPGHVRYIRDFANRRRVHETNGTMNRLYVVEAQPTLTGANADHRLPLRACDIDAFTRSLAAAVGLPVATAPSMQPHSKWIQEVAADLKQAGGRALVVAGDAQPPAVHALVAALNQTLGSAGKAISYIAPLAAQPGNQLESLQELASDIDAGKVNLLFILGGNPLYTAPADLRLAERFDKVALRVHAGLYADETAQLCHWHVPLAHELESWGDARAYDGTVTIQQPLIAPLYGAKSLHEVLAVLSSKPSRSGHDIVHAYWQSTWGGGDIEARWRRALHDGVLADSAAAVKTISASTGFIGDIKPLNANAGLEVAIRPDSSVYDGRFANNGWLQELPRPLSKLTWDNTVMLSPATAERLQLSNQDVVELKYQGRSVKGPVWITPGHANDSVTVTLGYGRAHAGRVAAGAGFNAYGLRSSATPWGGAGLEVVRTGATYQLSCTQDHFSLEGRDILRIGTLEEYKHDPRLAPHEHGAEAHEEHQPSIYPEYEYRGYAWGMAIDLNACVGCNACTIACQSENNIAVVGKDQVGRGREMHWIRVDRYFEGSLDNPEMVHQPVPCMHCEKAPCELVCPVNATVHSSEGLNEMVYNRCVGTKYCSNNCPYKVRRFNFFKYQDWQTESLKPMRNPDVSIRSRGVMEKCTYCVQRINHGRIQAKREGRTVRDGEIVTACQQVCPAEAITFGDINDPNSRVAKLRAQPRNYELLGELNTKPRTTYLAGVRNPNPRLATAKGEA